MKAISLYGNHYTYFRRAKVLEQLECEFITKLFDYFILKHPTLGHTGFLITEYCQVVKILTNIILKQSFKVFNCTI